MKEPTNNLIFIARVCVNESRARRLRMSHLPHQMAFSWALLNSAANFRRRYMESKKPVVAAQCDLFGATPC